MKDSVKYFLVSFCLFLLVEAINFVCAQAISDEKSLLQNLSKAANKKERFLILLRLGKQYQQIDLLKADSLRGEINSLSINLGDSARFAALIFDAEMDKSKGNKELYYNKILTLQSYLNDSPSKKIKLQIYQRLGEFHQYSREFDQADFYLNESLKISKNLRDNQGTAETYILLSFQEMQRNNKEAALLYVNEAIQYSRRSAKKEVMASALNSMAIIYAYFGQVELSVSKNLIALQLSKESGAMPKIAQYLLELGIAQMQIENYREAQLYFSQANETANSIRNYRLVALSYVYMGSISLIGKKYDEALQLENKALDILGAYNDLDGLGLCFNKLGDIYREKKEYASALSHYNKALVYFESSGNREQTATVYHSVGIVFEKQGKHANALNYLNRALDIRSQFGFKGAVYGTYKTISEVYAKTGNKEKAYSFLKMYSNYIDSAKTIESSAKIAELSELYRSEQRERLISIQADSIERQRQEKTLTSTKLENIQLKNNLQTYVIFGFAVSVILGGIIFFYRWNQTKIRQQQKEAEMNQTLLRAQMNPHFVFNAMSVIQSYIYDNDIKNSSKFLVAFSKLMRLILENSSKEFIPIETEQLILDKYLSIQKLRFEERFEYKIEMAQQLIDEGVVIPPMITQPFIENAIEHGQLHLREDGYIHVHFYEKNKMLHITVEDNGIGRKGSAQSKKSSAHKSMAMKITRDRIENLNKKYRSEGFMKIEDLDKKNESGTKVLISIPYRVQTQIQNPTK